MDLGNREGRQCEVASFNYLKLYWSYSEIVLYVSHSKWASRAVQWSSEPVLPACYRPSALHDQQQQSDRHTADTGCESSLSLKPEWSFNLFVSLLLYVLDLAPFSSFFCVFASGGWCQHRVHHQWCDEWQHGDWQRVMGHSGLGGSLACHWHTSTLFRRLLPSVCAMLSPTLACWPGTHQAEPSCLLWADQSERQSAHGHLRPQVLKYHRKSAGGALGSSVSLCVTGRVLLQSQYSGSGSGQWRGQRWAKVTAFPALVRCWEKWRQNWNHWFLPWPYLHSQPVCLLSMWTHHKSKIPSLLLQTFITYFHFQLVSQKVLFEVLYFLLPYLYLYIYLSPSRNWVTRGYDCAPILTPLPKSVCVPLVFPGTTTLPIPALVSNSGTFKPPNIVRSLV